MNNINILEELNRIKFLLNYETGKLISEQVTKTVTKEKTDTGVKITEVTKEGIPIGPYTQNVNFPTGSNAVSPDTFKTFTDGIMNLINTNPETKKMLEEKNIQLTFIDVIGGASNTWGGNPTGYDMENDRKTAAKTTPTDSGYTSNKNLATQRAQIFLNNLIAFLSQQGITVNNEIPKKSSAYVINTGGFGDNDTRRDPKFLPGQFVSVNLKFNYVKTTTTERFEPRFDPKYIIQGSYNCAGISGNKTRAKIDSVVPNRCSKNNTWQIPLSNNPNYTLPYDGKAVPGSESFLAIYEIKFNKMFSDDIAKKKIQIDTKIQPFIRWNFSWDKGKIVKITIGNAPDVGENIITNNNLMNELKQYMNLPKYSPETKSYSSPKNSFEDLVKKYI